MIASSFKWLNEKEDFFSILQTFVQQYDELQKYLSFEDIQFMQHQSVYSDFQNTVKMAYLHEDLSQLCIALDKWRVLLFENYEEMEFHYWKIGDIMKKSLEGYYEQSLNQLNNQIKEMEQEHNDYWYSIFMLVYSFLCLEKKMFCDVDKQLMKVLLISLACKQRQLVCWCLYILGRIRKDTGILTDLLLFCDRNSVIGGYVKYELYQYGLVSFQECIHACQNSENMIIARKVINLEMKRNGNGSILENWKKIENEKEPWKNLVSIL